MGASGGHGSLDAMRGAGDHQFLLLAVAPQIVGLEMLGLPGEACRIIAHGGIEPTEGGGVDLVASEEAL